MEYLSTSQTQHEYKEDRCRAQMSSTSPPLYLSLPGTTSLQVLRGGWENTGEEVEGGAMRSESMHAPGETQAGVPVAAAIM